MLLPGAALLGALGGCPGGPRDLSGYPDPRTSPYRLPFPDGEASLCVQGNEGLLSHAGSSRYAYDFLMASGSPVVAARAGVVVEVREDQTRIGRREWNNALRVRHDDGSVASYLHLAPQGVLVEVGERVAQGQVVARSGWTGYAMVPHLHFHVSRGGRQVPVTFRDVSTDGGVPRSGCAYRAGGRR